MSDGAVPGLSERQERLLTRAMQLALGGLLAYGLVTLQLGMAANGGFALGVTLLPALLRREYNYAMTPVLVLWLTVAVFLHSFGSIGPYRWFSWYDEIAHTVSASVIAGLGYASFRALERHSDDIEVPAAFRGVFIVVFVLAAGVIWELMEFASGHVATLIGTDAPLVVMGIDDIVTDFVFNAVGAVLVALAGTDAVGGLVGFFRGRLRASESE
jgi:hypothetical protein